MRRTFALRAEIARRSYQRTSEVPTPNTIHNHAGRQRGRVADNPLGQLQPSGAVAEGRWLALGEDGEEAARYRLSGPGDVAADEHGQIARDTGAQVDPGHGRIAAADRYARVD